MVGPPNVCAGQNAEWSCKPDAPPKCKTMHVISCIDDDDCICKGCFQVGRVLFFKCVGNESCGFCSEWGNAVCVDRSCEFYCIGQYDVEEDYEVLGNEK